MPGKIEIHGDVDPIDDKWEQTDEERLALERASTRLVLDTTQRSAWLHKTARALGKNLVTKYVAGQLEHKSDLGKVTLRELLNEMKQEHLDALAYIAELERRIDTGHVKEER